MSANRAFLDTNVLVYVFDRDEPEKAMHSKSLLEVAEPDQLVLSAQVLGEFYVTVTRKLRRPLDADHAGQAVDWFSRLKVISIDSAMVKRAGEISRSSQISYWDGLIVASAASYGCQRLFTEDLNDGQTIAGVRIENPFRHVG